MVREIPDGRGVGRAPHLWLAPCSQCGAKTVLTIHENDGVDRTYELVEDYHGVLWVKAPFRRHVLKYALQELRWRIVAAEPRDQARLKAAGLWEESAAVARPAAATRRDETEPTDWQTPEAEGP